MKKLVFFATCSIAFAAPAPASAQSLDNLLRTVGRLASGAKSVTPRSQAFTPMTVSASPADAAALKLALDRAIAGRGATSRALTEARPLIEKLLMTIGCATDVRALNSLNAFRLKPYSYQSGIGNTTLTAMGGSAGGMSHHDRRTCAQVLRVTDLKQLALNAFSLRVYYLSPSSGEARDTTVSFRKMDSEWLIDEIREF